MSITSKIHKVAFLLLGLMVGGVIVFYQQPLLTFAGLVPQGTPFQGFATSGRIAVVGTLGGEGALRAASLLGTTSNRVYASIVNDCATAVYLTYKTLGKEASSTFQSYGMRLNANGGSFEITQDNLYTGPIFASSTALCNVFVSQSINQ